MTTHDTAASTADGEDGPITVGGYRVVTTRWAAAPAWLPAVRPIGDTRQPALLSRLREAIADACQWARGGIVLDLTDQATVCINVLACLMTALRAFGKDGEDGPRRRILVLAPSPFVRRVFVISGLSNLMTVCADSGEIEEARQDILLARTAGEVRP